MDAGNDLHVLTGVGLRNSWNRAGGTQIRSPVQRRVGSVEKAAFLMGSAAVVIAIEIAAFFAGRCMHGWDYSMGQRMRNGSTDRKQTNG